MKVVVILVCCAILACVTGCASVPRQHDDLGLNDPLARLLTQRNYSHAERLLKGGYPVASKAAFTNAPAYWAIAEGDVQALRLLVRFGLDVNYDWGEEGGNLLTNAVQFGQLEQVQMLVESGASLLRDPRYGRSPLYAAVIYDQKEIEKYLRGRAAQFNAWDLEAFRVLRMSPP